MSEPLDAAQWNAARRRRRTRGCLLVVVAPLAVVVALLGWMTLRLFEKPTISRNYVAEFNARFEGIPEDERAWPLYKEAIIERLAVDVPEDVLNQWPTFPGGPQWAESARVIESLGPVLDKVRRASRLPVLGRELSDALDPEIARAEAEARGVAFQPSDGPTENPMLIGVLLPELGYLRRFAKDFSADIFQAAEAGDAARVADDLTAMLGLALHARESETLIGQLVQVAIEFLAERHLSQLLTGYPDLLGPGQLGELQRAFETIGRPGPAPAEGLTRIGLEMRFERQFFDDTLQRCYSDDGHGDGYLTLEGVRMLNLTGSMMGERSAGVSGVAMVMMAASRKQTAEKHGRIMDRFEAAAAKRPWERQPGELGLDAEVWDLEGSALGGLRYRLITLLMPALERAAAAMDLADARRDAAITTIALARFRAEHGEYPEKLEDLVPGYLRALPRDPIDGQPLRYARTAAGAVLYSLGYDKDDDAGQPSRKPEDAWPFGSFKSGDDADGDWVLFPTAMPEPPEEDE